MNILFLSFLLSAAVTLSPADICIVPQPVSIEIHEGTIPADRQEAITIEIKSKLAYEEYVLDISRTGIRIDAGSQAGAFYAHQSLKQLKEQFGGSIPCMTIKDKPELSYRGAHLDCCRHFFSIDEVKRYIDLCALHKLNIFHWHLTDDQGWRIEIRKYPRLTEVGSTRKGTKIGHVFDDTKGYDNIPYGGWYTQEECREIVRYAAERFITVVPEIEMPGHALAALSAYPELGCTGGPYETSCTWGVFPDIFCAGNEATVNFLKDVLDEVCDIFPSKYIHIGGDEAPRDRWKECPRCQAKMKELGLKSEAQLQSCLVDEIEKHLAAKGRHIIGWEEILEGGVSQSAIVMSWQGAECGKKAARMGNDVVMAPYSHLYLDFYQTDDPAANGEPLCIGGCTPIEKVYSFNPYEDLTPEAGRHILGVQANIWTEYVPDFYGVMFRALPRMAALSELGWSASRRLPYAEFLQKCKKTVFPLYRKEGYIMAPYAGAGINANDEKIRIVGRSVKGKDGSVSFDWSGTEMHIAFTGTELSMVASDSGADWFNLWVDKKPVAKEDSKFLLKGRDSLIVLARGLENGKHVVHIQKRTEGEQGKVSVRKFFCDGEFEQAGSGHERLIEIIGDSYTCGYGSESGSRDDPFQAETENCNLSYSGILGRFFDADVVRIAHSGRGLVRNYGGYKSPTMIERYDNCFDMEEKPVWDFRTQIPDIVIIYLGTNDFSCGEKPSIEEWKKASAKMVGLIRSKYGKTVPILMVASRASYELAEYVRAAKAELEGQNVHWTALFEDIHNNTNHLGASWHPNYEGHRRVACGMIPYVSTLTGWSVPNKSIE